MKRLNLLIIQCLILACSLESLAADDIIDPTAISIKPWQVYVGEPISEELLSDNLRPDDLISNDLKPDALILEKSIISRPRNPSQSTQDTNTDWRALSQYATPYLHIPTQETRWFHSSFIVGWHHKNAQLALYLGPLYPDAEVYVNGIKLSALDANTATHSFRRTQTRIYRLPRQKLLYSFLDFQVENQVLIRLTSDKEPLILIADQIEIDSYDSLALKAKDADTLIKIAQGGMVALLLSFCLFSVFMRAVGFKERNNTLFGLYVICVAGVILSNSLLLPASFMGGVIMSSLPNTFTTLSVLILVTLLSPKQRLSKPTKQLFLLNIVILISLLFDLRDSTLSQTLALINQMINAIIVIHALFISVLRTNKAPTVSNNLLLGFVLIGWCAQSFWAFHYSPVQPLEIALFVAALVLLLNVAQRFRAMASSLLTLSNRLVSIREKERARLTRDIHDGVGQGLSTLKLLINLNANKLESNLGEMLQTEVSKTSNTLKSVIRNLKPIEVVSGSTTQAIINLAQHNGHLANIGIQLLSKDNVKLSQERAYQVYRIGQEALNNALKHSNAKQITLSFIVTGQCYKMRIEDDGKGLHDSISDDSYGMSSMHERSMILSATLTIKNNDSGGTVILLEVPIDD